MQLTHLEDLNAERAARRAAIIITDLATGTSELVREAEAEAHPLADPVMRAFATNKSGMVEVDDRKLFLTTHMPAVRVLVLGAVHISQALSPMAKLADFDVTIIDPRTAFASEERFPDGNVIAEWPQDVVPRLGLDRYTAFVALTHDPKIDDEGLKLAAQSQCFYIGALGSRKSHAKRLERLAAAGLTPDETARIRGPVGLNIGAVSPAEIALSIVAEIIATLRAERVARKGEAGVSLVLPGAAA